MREIKNYFCFESYYMSTGDIAFKKGKIYKGFATENNLHFKSEVTVGMNHIMYFETIKSHLKLFKFGR